VFEQRYRDMVTDALDGDRLIGMVLLRPGWEGNYEGRPPVYPIGCAGLITHHERLPDGRYNIVLRGLEKFRILSEDAAEGGHVDGTSSHYRVARVETLHEPLIEAERDQIRAARRRLEALLVPQAQGRGESNVAPAMSDEDVVNALAQYMQLEPLEKQALLERHGLLARCRSLIELLEMKMIVARHDWTNGRH
jgi:Lon protease-like protein